jgi:N-acetylglucosaminyldiphosphoundecaprenol N-acetyl-beta-D-mannosaminyltransferase
MAPTAPLASRLVLGMRVDATSYADATLRILEWADRRESRYVCAANVHMTMEAHDDPGFRTVVNAADLVTPDGMPLVWVLRRLGLPDQPRVYGPDLMLAVCAAAARAGIPVGVYGGLPAELSGLAARLEARYPTLRVAYQGAPPFRPLTPAEDEADVAHISASGARVLFVGLGCPKQERWMAAHRGRVEAVMLGVGAAFAMHAGTLRQAPARLQRMGLEWLFRLSVEPRRLWRRYARHNPRFVALVVRQLLRERRPAR